MKKNAFFLLWILTAFVNSSLYSQNTFQQVRNIFQVKCINCHNNVNLSGGLDLGADDSTVYANLIGKTPSNAKAQQLGFKRIDPGNPHRSFLLRKINNGLDADNDIGTGEGGAMPLSPNPALSDYEIELVRQWVLFGAPQAGSVVDTSLIYTYYTVGGINSVPAPLTPPPPGQGFQVHLGKIFIPPNTEDEVFIKYNLQLSSPIEVNRVQLAQSPQSHHFVIYKFFAGQDVSFPEGLRDTSISSHGSSDFITAFSPLTNDQVLPAGTAYFLPQTTVLDLNYHMVNYSADSVLAMEVYFNFYTQPVGTAEKYMFYRVFPNFDIIIPPGDTSVFTVAATDSNATAMWNIWLMFTHTHRYGLDYDVWFRNADGSQGAQVYEGWYNFEYTFNQGYYGWGVESAQEYFDPLLEVNPMEGFFHRAVFYNYGTDTLYFGLTSQDEMMVMGFQYVDGNPLSVDKGDVKFTPVPLDVFPNPSGGKFIVSVSDKELEKGNVAVINSFGEVVFSCTMNSHQVPVDLSAVPAGIYFLRLNAEDKVHSKKLLKVK